MKSLRVSSKLTVSFFIVIVLTVIIGAAGIVGMVIINSGSRQLYETQSRPLADLGMAREYFQRLRVQMRDVVIASGDTAALDKIEAALQDHEHGFVTYMAAYSRTIDDPYALRLYDEIMEMFGVFQPGMQQILASARVNAPPVQMRIMLDGLVVPTDFITDALYYLAYARVIQASHLNEINTFWFRALFIMILTVGAAGAGSAMFLSRYISGNISKPLEEIGRFAEKVATGEIPMSAVSRNTINVHSSDEMGALARTLEKSYVDLNRNEQSRRRLTEENAALERLSLMKTEYLANISHETKTPLTIISVNIQLAADLYEAHCDNCGEDGKIILEALSRAQEAILRVGRVTENSLWLASMQESRERMAAIEISTLITNSAEMRRNVIEKTPNTLNLRLSRYLPKVYGNADNLIQVMDNLLTNANNHTKNGEITVTASYNAEDGFIEVSVTDTGSGVAPEILPNIFKRGVSGSGGTGIGLNICRKIIENHGGTIRFERPSGRGTTVKFTVPVINLSKGAENV